MAICSATTACASKNASLTSGLRPVEKLSPTIGTTNRPFTGILPLSQRVAHAHCLSRARRHKSVNVALLKVRAPAGRDRQAVLKAIQENRMTLPWPLELRSQLSQHPDALHCGM